ncbi:MAG: winged helix-turn-helix domain-containing protein [Pseudomonadota bacterium]
MNLRDGFLLGDWTVLPLEGRLQRGDDERHVTPKSMDVLLCLADAAGGVVERESLLANVWGERAVSDEPLTRCIADLRKALDDSRSDPTYIMTVPKRGYRLLTAPRELNNTAPPSAASEETLASRAARFVTLRKMLVGFAVLVLAAVVQIVIERAIDRPTDASVAAAVAPIVDDRSVAVLPFEDMTAAQDQAYFADGLAEELMSLLAGNPALTVTSRTSAFQFRESSLAAPEIGQRLGVRHLVEGSVARDGDLLRIRTQLVDAASGNIIWRDRFDQPVGNIFDIQEDISARVAATLEVSALGDTATARRTDPEAYTLYLEARHLARGGNQQEFENAIELLREAVLIDPDYAPAWAQMADVYNNLAGQGFWDWDRGFAAAREAAETAVAADPEYAGGHAELAWVAHRYDGDLRAAFAHMQRALAINSLDVTILPDAAILLLQAGQLDQAIDVLRYCIRRSPTDPRLRYNLGVTYKYADQLEGALVSFRKVREMNPDYNGAQYQLAETLLLTGEPEAALAEFEALSGYNRLKGISVTRYIMDDADGSDAALAELTETWAEKWPGVIADVYAFRGELDAAFEWLDKDYEKYGAAGWGEVRLQRWYDNLRDDDRWHAFLDKVGLDEDKLTGLNLELDIPRS